MTRLLLLAAVIIWGWTFVATKICLAFMTPMELVAGRFLIGLPILYALIRHLKIRLLPVERDKWMLLAVSLVVCAHFIVQVIGLQFTTASKTGWMITITPLVTAALSALFLRERLSFWQWGGIFLATFGVVLLIGNGDFSSLANFGNIGDWLVLLSAHTWAIYSILSRRLIPERAPLATTFLAFLPLAAISIVWSLLLADSPLSPTADHKGLMAMSSTGWIALLFLGTLGTLSQWFWQTAIAKIGAARAGVYLYLEPIATTVLAVPLLNEPISTYLVIGALCILGGVWLAERKQT